MIAKFINGPWDGRTEPIPDAQAANLNAAWIIVSPSQPMYDGQEVTRLPDGRFVPKQGLTKYRFTRMETPNVAIFGISDDQP